MKLWTMFCWETLGADIYVNVSLAHIATLLIQKETTLKDQIR